MKVSWKDANFLRDARQRWSFTENQTETECSSENQLTSKYDVCNRDTSNQLIDYSGRYRVTPIDECLSPWSKRLWDSDATMIEFSDRRNNQTWWTIFTIVYYKKSQFYIPNGHQYYELTRNNENYSKIQRRSVISIAKQGRISRVNQTNLTYEHRMSIGKWSGGYLKPVSGWKLQMDS